MEFCFIKNYKEDKILRASFNQLAEQTYGLNFELWYQKGFWNEKYNPYSFMVNNQVIANISVNKMDLIIEGTRRNVIQLGTVMTHPTYRNNGLIRKLMDMILNEYDDVDFIYLFANETVLDFYPKFGFVRMNEKHYSMDVKSTKLEANYVKLDVKEDFDLIKRLTKNRVPISHKCGVTNDQDLLMFYILYVYRNDVYYLKKYDCIVLSKLENNTLNIFDVISSKEFNLDTLLDELITKEVTNIHFNFIPDRLNKNVVTNVLDNHLFIKPINMKKGEIEITLPITSIA